MYQKDKYGWAFFCPGCNHVHVYLDTWKFNGDHNAPTFTPSLLVFVPEFIDDGVKIPRQTVCHLFITNGQIRFCSDSAHKLKGKTVPMSDWPKDYKCGYTEVDA